MLDFKELSVNGNELELLIREILLLKGFRVHWSGKGPDGGRDLICFEERGSEFYSDKKIWLIQCKHNAISGQSVGVKDLDNIVDSCNHHGAKGYLLVCSTYPSSAVINRLESITSNPSQNIDATYWDATIIEQKLSTPQLWKVAQQFFPESSKNATWEIFATEKPNQWIVNFKGHHFHLSNRIGSSGRYHFKTIEKRIEAIKTLPLKKGHFIRLRALYFDDKNGNYTWYMDYMFPRDAEPQFSSIKIAIALGHDYVLEDGQFHQFDVIRRPYYKESDHYDKDHYDYYVPHLHSFYSGTKRQADNEIRQERFMAWQELAAEKAKRKNELYNELVEKLKNLKDFRLVRSLNCSIEDIDKFVKLRDWEELIDDQRRHEEPINIDHFFSALFLFDVGKHEKKFLKFISLLPQDGICGFRLTKVFVYVPSNINDGAIYDQSIDSLFELSIKFTADTINTSLMGRELLNDYFRKFIKSIAKYELARLI